MTDLTVPADRLPAGCLLTPRSTERLENGRVVRTGGLWAGLPISSNPWVGSDPRITASIVERMVDPASMPAPDGPPLDRRAMLRFHARLAEGVDEAYAAVYRHEPDAMVLVYAARPLPPAALASPEGRAAARNNPRVIRAVIGSTAVLIHGDIGPCLGAVGAHVASLARPR